MFITSRHGKPQSQQREQLVQQVQLQCQMPILLEARTLPTRPLPEEEGRCPHGGHPRETLPKPELQLQFHTGQHQLDLFKLLAGLDHAPPPDHSKPQTERLPYHVNTNCQMKSAILEWAGTSHIQTLAVLQQKLSVTASYHAGVTQSCLDFHIYHHFPQNINRP
jgi:hypothetical protein